MRVIQKEADLLHWKDAFKKELISQDLSPATIKAYMYDISAFERWYQEIDFKKLQLSAITPFDLTTFRQYLTNQKNQRPTSVNRRINTLKRLFAWAALNRLVREDVSEEVKFIRYGQKRQPKALNMKEIHALLRVAGQSSHNLAKRNYALLQLLLQTGIRIGEVANLKLSDMVLNSKFGYVRIKDGKGLKVRDVPLNASARRAIQKYLDTRTALSQDVYLFNSKRGKAISLRALQQIVFELAKKSHITRINVSAHTLRHTFATHYLKQNPGKLVDLASLMGHESLDTTACYTRPSDEDLADDLENSELNIYDD